ncbi:nucleotidyltransferase [bacterium]|nr:nucleotidyltransferase [bacterium]
MSFDESFLSELLEALITSGLEAIIIGNSAAILLGVPVMTQDVDLLVRKHPQLNNKLDRFAKRFGVSLTRPCEPTSEMIRAVGRSIHVDFILKLSTGQTFSQIRSRAHKVKIGKRSALVADLKDIIKAKEATGRPKDQASLPLLKQSLRVLKEIKKLKD